MPEACSGTGPTGPTSTWMVLQRCLGRHWRSALKISGGTGKVRENGQSFTGKAKFPWDQTVGYPSWRQDECRCTRVCIRTCLGGRYRLGRGPVDLDSEDHVQAGSMYSQAMVKTVEVTETGRAMPLVIEPIEN